MVNSSGNPEIYAGTLDGRVTLLKPVYNEFEDEILDYAPVIDVLAAVNPSFGQEIQEAGRVVATVMVEVIIRFRADIDARWRIQDGPHVYRIKGILDVARRGAQLKLNCLEVQ